MIIVSGVWGWVWSLWPKWGWWQGGGRGNYPCSTLLNTSTSNPCTLSVAQISISSLMFCPRCFPKSDTRCCWRAERRLQAQKPPNPRRPLAVVVPPPQTTRSMPMESDFLVRTGTFGKWAIEQCAFVMWTQFSVTYFPVNQPPSPSLRMDNRQTRTIWAVLELAGGYTYSFSNIHIIHSHVTFQGLPATILNSLCKARSQTSKFKPHSVYPRWTTSTVGFPESILKKPKSLPAEASTS